MHLTRILLDAEDTGLIRGVSFAYALKKLAVDLVEGRLPYESLKLPPLVTEQLRSLGEGLTVQDIKDKPPQARMFLQFLGTDAMRRNVDDQYWVKRARQSVLDLTWIEPRIQVIYLTDCRFPNEVEMVRSLGGKVWRIERPAKFAEQAKDTHPSETALDDFAGWDGLLVADDMTELLSEVEKQLRKLGLYGNGK